MRNLAKIIEKDAFLKEQSPVLLACSGGMDSMCLAHLLKSTGIQFQIAHVNYKLRGLESDLDQDLVIQWAWENGITVWTRTIDLSNFQGNIQAKAREERYSWFRSLMSRYGFSKILTAHHADDQLEGVLLKWMRGIPWEDRFLMPEMTKDIYRPLLSISKEDVITWTFENQIPYRTDRSNLDADKYDRNFIRLDLLDPLKNRKHGILDDLLEKAIEEERARKLFHWMVEKLSSDHVEITARGWILQLADFLGSGAPEQVTLLSHFLKTKGCPGTLATQILNASTGAIWTCSTGSLLLDRHQLIYQNNQSKVDEQQPILVTKDGLYRTVDGQSLDFRSMSRSELPLSPDKNTLFLEKGEFDYPFIWRPWVSGDRIAPLGMGGKHKKVQDIFTDNKIDRFQKQRIWLLFKEDKLLWIPGLKQSEHTRQKASDSAGILVTFNTA